MKRFVSLLGAVALVVASCGTPSPTGGQETAKATSDTPVPGGRLVLAQTGDPKSFNPILVTDTGSGAFQAPIYISLLTRDAQSGEIAGQLAEKWNVSQDGLTLTYTLRDGLTWSDGTPFTGEDYKYTAEATMRSKRTTRQSAFQNVVGAKDYKDGKTNEITGIQVKDNGKTVEIKFTKGECSAVENLAGAGAGRILPSKPYKQYFDPRTTDTSKTIDENPLNMAPPASMGPWIFKDFKAGDRATYVKNPRYWKGEPLIDELVIKVYSDTAAIKAALLVGEVTYAGATPQDFDELSKTEGLRGFEFPDYGWTYLGWNPDSPKAPWLANKLVRQALWYSLDRKAIIDKIVLGHGKLLYGAQPPASVASYKDDDLNHYDFDPKKAKALIEQAGAKMGPDGIYRWTDGSPMKMRIETNQPNPVRETVLQLAQEQYKQIGVQIDPILESFNTLLERIRCCGTDFEGWISGFTGVGPDPEQEDLWHSRHIAPNEFNRWRYKNPDVDKAEDQLKTGPDCSPATRNKLAHDVDKRLNEDAPVIFVYAPNNIVFANKNLVNFAPTAVSTTYNLEKWWFRK
jgi:peptide/nickel transport system substrate-binding protein